MILDLRYNPGGLLVAATDISDKFLSSGTIVSTRADRENAAQTPTSSEARASADDFDLPMIVLVNQYSASASEIVAGALKDHHRATIIGERHVRQRQRSDALPAGRSVGLSEAHDKPLLSAEWSLICIAKRIRRRGVSIPMWSIEMTPKQMGEAIEARQDQEVIRDLNEEPATQPTTKPKKDILATDSQLSTALLVMRLQLAGASL